MKLKLIKNVKQTYIIYNMWLSTSTLTILTTPENYVNETSFPSWNYVVAIVSNLKHINRLVRKECRGDNSKVCDGFVVHGEEVHLLSRQKNYVKVVPIISSTKIN